MMIHPLSYEVLIKVLLSMLVGGAIGFEREFHDKAAGFRTLILISLGSCLFTIFSRDMTGGLDYSRIAAQVVSGVGFLGAGVILSKGGRVFGLTTSATIWLTAAMGMGIGAGQIQLVLLITPIVLLVLRGFLFVEKIVNHFHQTITYEVSFSTSNGFTPEELEKLMQDSQLRLKSIHRARTGVQYKYSWTGVGKRARHENFIRQLLKEDRIDQVRY